MTLLYDKKISAQPMPVKGEILNNFIDEPMVNLAEYFSGSIQIENAYYKKGIKGAPAGCLVRLSVAEKLEKANELLPDNITFKVYDAWRPFEVQKELYQSYYEELQREHKDWSDLKTQKEIVNFVSKPVHDAQAPAVHSTGGAIDLTLAFKDTGKTLDMGTEFDDFTVLSHTNSFEQSDNEEVKRNRRLLYWTMTEAGFTDVPSEWWHYDYGDMFWAYYKKSPALYSEYIEKRREYYAY